MHGNVTTLLPDATQIVEGHVWKSFVAGGVTFLIISSNILNIVVLPHVKQIRTIGKLFLTNLSVSDLTVGLTVCFPGFITSVSGNQWMFGAVTCQISGVMHATAASVSIATLSFIASIKYIAAKYPLRYRSLTKRKCFIFLVVFWISLFIIYLIPIFVRGDYYYNYDRQKFICGMYWELRWLCYATGITIPFGAGTILFITTMKVIHVLKKHKLPGESVVIVIQSRALQDRKAIKLLIITATVYYIAWGPYVIREFFWHSTKLPPTVDFIFMWLANINGFVNVIIYSAMYKQFRDRSKNIMLYLLRFPRAQNTCVNQTTEYSEASTYV